MDLRLRFLTDLLLVMLLSLLEDLLLGRLLLNKLLLRRRRFLNSLPAVSA